MNTACLQHRGELNFKFLLPFSERPFVSPRIVEILGEIVALQVERRFNRRGFVQIPWRGTKYAPHREKASRDQRVRRRRKDLNREIEALLNGVDDAVADRHLEVNLRIHLPEGDQRLRKMAKCKAGDHMDAQRTCQ